MVKKITVRGNFVLYDEPKSLTLIYLSALQVVEYILDRNACLLPAYLAVTEIRKLYPEGQLSHWVSVRLFVFVSTCSRKMFSYVSLIVSPRFLLTYLPFFPLFLAPRQFDIGLR